MTRLRLSVRSSLVGLVWVEWSSQKVRAGACRKPRMQFNIITRFSLSVVLLLPHVGHQPPCLRVSLRQRARGTQASDSAWPRSASHRPQMTPYSTGQTGPPRPTVQIHACLFIRRQRTKSRSAYKYLFLVPLILQWICNGSDCKDWKTRIIFKKNEKDKKDDVYVC